MSGPAASPPATVTGSGAPSPLAGGQATAPAPETCPLCGAPLPPEQEWCLRCGAAARTRLATSSNWKAPIVVIAVVAALSLGVLAAALLKLAGAFDTTTTPATTTAAASVVVTPTTPTTAPGASTPSATTTPNPGAASGPLSKEPTVAPPAGAAPTQLETKDLITGTGAEAKAGETLTVNYVGILLNGGAEFDSSWKRGKRFTFTLGTSQVIEGWNQGVPGMKVGGRRELIIPPTLAYGAKGFATTVPIPPNAPLVFVVDLLEASAPPASTSPTTGTSGK